VEILIERSVRVKAAVVQADERESGARKQLNLGHTLGHALEAATAYESFLHGEAVGWGMRAACRISRRRDLLSDQGHRRLEDAVDRIGSAPAIDDIPVAVVLDHLAHDKKRDDLGISWVLPTDDGVILDQRVTADEISEVFKELNDTS
jgi:3-dehydroquinate synthase